MKEDQPEAITLQDKQDLLYGAISTCDVFLTSSLLDKYPHPEHPHPLVESPSHEPSIAVTILQGLTTINKEKYLSIIDLLIQKGAKLNFSLSLAEDIIQYIINDNILPNVHEKIFIANAFITLAPSIRIQNILRIPICTLPLNTIIHKSYFLSRQVLEGELFRWKNTLPSAMEFFLYHTHFYSCVALLFFLRRNISFDYSLEYLQEFLKHNESKKISIRQETFIHIINVTLLLQADMPSELKTFLELHLSYYISNSNIQSEVNAVHFEKTLSSILGFANHFKYPTSDLMPIIRALHIFYQTSNTPLNLDITCATLKVKRLTSLIQRGVFWKLVKLFILNEVNQLLTGDKESFYSFLYSLFTETSEALYLLKPLHYLLRYVPIPKLLRSFLRQNPSLLFFNNKKTTILHLALRVPLPPLIALIIKNRFIDVNIRNNAGLPPLHEIVHWSEAYLKNSSNTWEVTQYASFKNIKNLVKNGADVCLIIPSLIYCIPILHKAYKHDSSKVLPWFAPGSAFYKFLKFFINKGLMPIGIYNALDACQTPEYLITYNKLLTEVILEHNPNAIMPFQKSPSDSQPELHQLLIKDVTAPARITTLLAKSNSLFAGFKLSTPVLTLSNHTSSLRRLCKQVLILRQTCKYFTREFSKSCLITFDISFRIITEVCSPFEDPLMRDDQQTIATLRPIKEDPEITKLYFSIFKKAMKKLNKDRGTSTPENYMRYALKELGVLSENLFVHDNENRHHKRKRESYNNTRKNKHLKM